MYFTFSKTNLEQMALWFQATKHIRPHKNLNFADPIKLLWFYELIFCTQFSSIWWTYFVMFLQVTNFSSREKKLPTPCSFGFELGQIMRNQVFIAEKSFTIWTKCCFWTKIVLGMSKWFAKVKSLTIFPF